MPARDAPAAPAASLRWPPAVVDGTAQIAVVVPFREQLPLQSRRAQLEKFVAHMGRFLGQIPRCRSAVIIVEQSQDGRKFNRGQLLNVGFRLAQEALPGLTSFITHDVDLLPSMDMAPVYANPPPELSAVHLASVWPKYTYGTFIGGVLAFSPPDFERCNGYPNDYWGWGLEDDQLALRMSNSKIRTLRVRVGSYTDLDPINMKLVLNRGQREEIRSHLPWYNPDLFRNGELLLDGNWLQNGLRTLEYAPVRSTTEGLVQHTVVHLGPVSAAGGGSGAVPGAAPEAR